MANIMVILPGVSLADCWDMSLDELADWHARALDRADRN